ncbi:BREX-1 system adenine-specific DNA-methyltransferase PglX [Burkholderia vietnamiensis]|nr:BREX-1 system adenine-specific DNA-methyltransferase PglX [Burkholderia vietnamiensis]
MNKANLKAYAPQARRDFIAAVTARANLLGISMAGSAKASVRGDLVIIEGREWPIKINAQREKLLRRIERRGFEQAMEEVAYTWFNRLAALRFMELHGYFDHGWRVLSSRDGGLPEILRYASEVSLPGLNKQAAREMQLAGTQDNELYKLLLVAQCNDLSRSMPFLFEQIDDETELLLPENLLRTDSIVAKLVESVPEDDWAQIEAVGWLYQFGGVKHQVQRWNH